MKIEEFDWDVAYEKVTDFLRNINAHDFIVATNKKYVSNEEPIVEISFPRKNNAATIQYLNDDNACESQKGLRKDGKFYCVYDIYVNRLQYATQSFKITTQRYSFNSSYDTCIVNGLDNALKMYVDKCKDYEFVRLEKYHPDRKNPF